MFEKMLYPTDFSDISLHALENCIPKIVKLGIKELHLLHVLDITILDLEAFSLQEVYMKRLEETAKKLGEKLKGNVKVVTQVPIGIPSVEIAEYANGNNIDIIVVPSAGENVWRRMLVGSTASNLARTSRKPVLLLKYEKKGEKSVPTFGSCSEIFKRPLVALDFSKCSLRIIRELKKFEELIEKGVLLHSVDYGRIEELEHNVEIAKKNLEKTAKGMKVPFEMEIMVGTASQAILGTSLAKNSTLIVIGKKGRSFLKDLILGSTAERIIRDSKIPVLLVPCG